MIRKNAIIIGIAVVVAASLYFVFDYRNKSKESEKQPALDLEINNPINNMNNKNTQDFRVNELKAEIIKEGTGEGAKTGDEITVHYIGALTNGQKFDSSVDRGQPFSFRLGAGMVIRGWDEGLVGMKVGEKRRLVIPPEFGYGEKGAGNVIPPNAALIFEIEMLKIN